MKRLPSARSPSGLPLSSGPCAQALRTRAWVTAGCFGLSISPSYDPNAVPEHSLWTPVMLSGLVVAALAEEHGREGEVMQIESSPGNRGLPGRFLVLSLPYTLK